MEDINDYKEVIKKYSDKQLIFESAIVEQEKNNIYLKEKALKEEMKRRLRE